MTSDSPKVGNIIVVDAETIARVMKVETDNIIVHALDFPFFRTSAVNNYDISTIKVAENTHKALTQLVLPTLSKDWSLEAWEQEIDEIVEYIVDDLEEEFDSYDTKSGVTRAFVRNKARHYVKQSDWYSEVDGQERCVKYSLHYLEITPEDILKAIPESERHIWTSVRKASALVHLSKDIFEATIEALDRDADDDYDEDDEDYDYPDNE